MSFNGGRKYNQVIQGIQTSYGLTKEEAEQVWGVGSEEHQQEIIGGKRFYSGKRYGEPDEYYISVFDADNNYILDTYHYED